MSIYDDLITVRANELGRGGQFLLKALPAAMNWDRFSKLSLIGQMSIVESVGAINGNICKAALSILASRVVYQVRLSNTEIKTIVHSCFESIVGNGVVKPIDLSKERLCKYFPLKPMKAAEAKVNISFSDAYESLLKEDTILARQVEYYSGYMLGLYNDEATAVIMAASIFRAYFDEPVVLALQMVLDPAGAKSLTTILKSLGMNSTRLGAVVCEGQVLKGRGTGKLDLKKEASARCGDEGIKGTPILFEDGILRRSIRGILLRELREKPEFENSDDWWSKRWLWCVNGGHSRRVEKKDVKWKVDAKGQVHRKVAMEAWTINPLYEWDGKVYVSAVEKDEHGKTRLILSTDTVSYAAFEHILSAVEKVWLNDRILLNPGKYGQAGTHKRVSAMGDGVNVMMDYDNFNIQHTTRSMQILFEELIDMTGYNKEYGSRLVSSFDNTYVYAGGEYVGKISASLMSGHRGTTFINSVLNAAYIKCCSGDSWDNGDMTSLHTGDDVVAVFHNPSAIEPVLQSLKTSGCKLNPLKQSVGNLSKEFLRMASTKEYGIGYALRSVASVISGNWVTENKLSGRDLLTSIITSSRALINRSGTDLCVRLLVKSVSQRTGFAHKKVKNLLLGLEALGGGPVYALCNGKVSTYNVVERHLESVTTMDSSLASNATSMYLSNHVSEIEKYSLELAELSVFDTMLEASYAKSLATGSEPIKEAFMLLKGRSVLPTKGVIDVDSLLKREKVEGVLSKYPIISMIKDRLTDDQLRELILKAGYNPGLDVRVKAFGPESRNVYIRGVIPYSDAASLSTKTNCDIIMVNRPVYM